MATQSASYHTDERRRCLSFTTRDSDVQLSHAVDQLDLYVRDGARS